MNTSILNKVNLYSICLLAFAIPLHVKLIPLLIVFVLITSFINGSLKSGKKKNISILLFTLLFIVYAISLSYSDNLKYGLADIETKLSLLLFPIAFFISKIDFKKNLNTILKWFVLGNLFASTVCIIDAVYHFVLNGEETELMYAKLSFFHHPSYFSLYLNLALIICIYYSFKKVYLILNNQKVTTLACFVFSLFIILLSAKTGIITLFLIIFITLFYWIKKSKAYLKSIVVLLLLSITLTVVYNASTSFKTRIDEFANTLTNSNKSKTSTSTMRIAAWKTSVDLIKTSPIIGYGVGDVKDKLIKSYVKQNLIELAEKKLNAHNQFLQTFLAVGLIGGLLFCCYFIFPLYFSFKLKYSIYLAFILLFAINIFTESMLERIAGVVFYAFFNSLFFAAYFNPPKKIEE